MELSPVLLAVSVPSVGTQIDPQPNIAHRESSEPNKDLSKKYSLTETDWISQLILSGFVRKKVCLLF